jgi:hypothetical protein
MAGLSVGRVRCEQWLRDCEEQTAQSRLEVGSLK